MKLSWEGSAFVVRATWPDSLQPGISVEALSTRGEKIELVTKVP